MKWPTMRGHLFVASTHVCEAVVVALDSLRQRFPGVQGEWARLDGPAGTQMVDTAIDATRGWSASGKNANGGGYFPAAHDSDEIVQTARSTMQRLLNAPSDTFVFGPNTTTLVFSFTRALARDFNDHDQIVGTKLDHDSNVTPWAMAAHDTGAQHVLADFDPETGRLDIAAVEKLITRSTKWVTVTGSSNLIGTMPDLHAITKLAHDAGARVYVDAVALVPHRSVDITAIGCDAIATSPYKWYGPHAGVLWIEPELLASLRPYKVRPASNGGPKKMETGTPNYEAIAGVVAAAEFMLQQGVDNMATYETAVFEPLLSGLLSINGVKVYGPQDLIDRAPTVSFNIAGHHPDSVAQQLADRKIAVWSGDSYAVEVAQQLGIASTGAAVRAGVVRYVTSDDVDRLLNAVADIASS